jgi:glycosyltransferase involved in cell wall biosynthesis
MNPSTAIIIATKGRPQEISSLLETLALQTVLPDMIVISACDRNDISQSIVGARNVEVLFGPPGLAAQRNRALSLVRGKFDIVIFLDDDFIPSRYWIEHIQILLATRSDVMCVTGRVLIDGVTSKALQWSDGQSIVNKADLPKKMVTMNDYKVQDHRSPYGCNMAFRAKNIADIRFDERLVLYGWLEDRDFAFRAGTGANMIWTDAVWGVHLGTRHGRAPGLGFGYSQVVNPWYLMKKGSMTPYDVFGNILRGFAGNVWGSFFKNSYTDRCCRLKGNIIGLKDIMTGRWAPEKVTEL